MVYSCFLCCQDVSPESYLYTEPYKEVLVQMTKEADSRSVLKEGREVEGQRCLRREF